jgi:hypothetical protein
MEEGVNSPFFLFNMLSTTTNRKEVITMAVVKLYEISATLFPSDEELGTFEFSVDGATTEARRDALDDNTRLNDWVRGIREAHGAENVCFDTRELGTYTRI